MRLKTTRHGIELCPTLPGQRTLTEQVRGIDVTLYEIESEIAYDGEYGPAAVFEIEAWVIRPFLAI